ncbi:MAG: hypothetical protein Q8933_19900 [Bacteroidota bacterium]|nr:hypothetical protein [Bacteroidota bacterium]MDP4197198.1 hypothetical protein [Bacteroidota bacterium]
MNKENQWDQQISTFRIRDHCYRYSKVITDLCNKVQVDTKLFNGGTKEIANN